MSIISAPSTERSRSNGASGHTITTPVAPVPPTDAMAVSDDAIAKLAYDKFIARGCVHGHDAEDWAAAKRDLLIGSHR